jgi:hypothetical protein
MQMGRVQADRVHMAFTGHGYCHLLSKRNTRFHSWIILIRIYVMFDVVTLDHKAELTISKHVEAVSRRLYICLTDLTCYDTRITAFAKCKRVTSNIGRRSIR